MFLTTKVTICICICRFHISMIGWDSRAREVWLFSWHGVVVISVCGLFRGYIGVDSRGGTDFHKGLLYFS